MTISPSAATIWRDYITDGVPASGTHPPRKSDIRSWGAAVEGIVNARGVTTLTSASSITDAMDGNVIFLSGSGFYAATVGAITTANWRCRVVNISNSTGRCVVNGGVKQRLYPGQHVDLFFDGTTVYMGKVPKWLASSPALYVDPVSGSDDPSVADGLATGARAFATRAAAIVALYQEIDAGGSYPTIHLANGTYAGTFQLNANPPGAPVIFWEGATAQGAVFSGVTIVADHAVHEATNIKFSGGVQIHQSGILDVLTGCGVGALTGANDGFATDGCGGTLNITASISVYGPMNYLFHAPSACTINISGGITITYVSSPVIGALARAVLGGSINMGSSISHSGSLTDGAQKWQAGPGGCISFSGNSGTWPGSVAGSPVLNAAPTGATGWAF